MNISNNNLVLILLGIVLLWVFMESRESNSENFNQDANEFVPVGSERHGLRGDMLRRSNIGRLYRNPNRQIRLSASGGDMYHSDRTPKQEGINGCKKVNCPCNTNEFDKQDTCWQCGSTGYDPQKIPAMHSH